MKQIWTTSEGLDYVVDRSGEQIVVDNNTYNCRVGTFDSIEMVNEFFDFYLGVKILEIIDI